MSTAFSLAKRGYQVQVLDQEEESYRGASWGNGGILVPSHFVPLSSPGTLRLGVKLMLDLAGPFGIRWGKDPNLIPWMLKFAKSATGDHVKKASPVLADLCTRSIPLHEALVDTLGMKEAVTRAGLVMVCEDERALEEETHSAEAGKEFGIKSRTVENFGEFFPGLQIKAKGGVFYESDAHSYPDQVMVALRQYLVAHGVKFSYSRPITHFRTRGSIVELAEDSHHQHLTADHYVLAGGKWTAELGRLLGLSIPVVGGQGQHLMVANPPVPMSHPMILVNSRVAITPMGDSIRFGGTMELGVTKPQINEKRLAGMKRSISTRLPQFTNSILDRGEKWSGLRPCSPDGLPIVGKLGKYTNVSVNTGHAMLGWTLGPITGELLAQEIAGEMTPDPEDLLRPSRWGL